MSGSDLYSAIKSMVNNKSPGNDGLTKAFYETCLDKIIDLLYKYVKYAKTKIQQQQQQNKTNREFHENNLS